MNPDRVQWYWRRFRRMSVSEMAWRARDQARKAAWQRRQVRARGMQGLRAPGGPQSFPVTLPPEARRAIRDRARAALLAAADELLAGRSELLGVTRTDMAAPDWFLDPVTGQRHPHDRYAFRIDHRSGNVKQVWEVSRHHHLTVLAAAWHVSRQDRYAEVVDRQLRSWWAENPFLSGVHWTSGIELGIRLISWTWIRRLLDGWQGAPELFEHNEAAALQIYWHQQYLAAFPAVGSSANNHVVAEAAGRLIASCAFPWFAESAGWRETAADLLEDQLERNTFPSGLNRELASDYHCLVAELGLLAAVEAEASGHPLGAATWNRLCRMVDVAAAIVDERGRGPRQGDSDDGRTLVVDGPGANPWVSLLTLGAELFGPLPWWPATSDPDVRTALLTSLAGGPKEISGRDPRRTSHFADAGFTLLRTASGDGGGPEIWCRCDGGPHGFLSIAAHAHADALSVEVRYGGVDVLADPGTYDYHVAPEWRTYFRSTVAHNTLELGAEDQSRSGGPFLWLSQASTSVLQAPVHGDAGGDCWSAQHDGYGRLMPPAIHRRTVRLDRHQRQLEILDRVETAGRHPCRLAYHLGPSIDAFLDGSVVGLEWPASEGAARATLELPASLLWATHRGEVDPILGWYSSGFGKKEPATTLLGTGTCRPGGLDLRTVLRFPEDLLRDG